VQILKKITMDNKIKKDDKSPRPNRLKIEHFFRENMKLFLGLLIGILVMSAGIAVAGKAYTAKNDNKSSRPSVNVKEADKLASENTKQGVTSGAEASNSSNSNGVTDSKSTDTQNNVNSSGPSDSSSEANSPTSAPKDMTLKGIEGLVATVHVGQAIFAPNVTPSEATLSYQWRYRTGTDPATGAQIYANIPGANSNPYYPTSSYLNKWISVVVTGTNGYTGSLPSPTDALVIN